MRYRMPLTASRIIRNHTEKSFNDLALQLFHYQYKHNNIYRKYVNMLGVEVSKIDNYKACPFLPISLFKKHVITTQEYTPDHFFESSGTSGQTSKHYFNDLAIYEQSFLKTFEHFYGAVSKYVIFALLPSYADNPHASLLYMANRLIEESSFSDSGFYHQNTSLLNEKLLKAQKQNNKCILLGVSFALLDFAEKAQHPYPELIIIETGGMKGKRKEIVRQALHDVLCRQFHVPVVHSEYGMTELFSQAYSKGHGVFNCPPWMKVLCRDIHDPLDTLKNGGSGCLNIIDLANKDSVSFIATDDMGTVFNDGSFSVSGRLDNTMARGCNLMIY